MDMHMELHRTNSDRLRDHFEECLKDADHSTLMTFAEGQHQSLKGICP